MSHSSTRQVAQTAELEEPRTASANVELTEMITALRTDAQESTSMLNQWTKSLQT